MFRPEVFMDMENLNVYEDFVTELGGDKMIIAGSEVIDYYLCMDLSDYVQLYAT